MAKCACKGSFLDRFIQPSILILLNKERLHGFSIYKKLSESDILDYTGIDPTGLYRTLKKMEEAGLVISDWDIEASAQPRRIYTITEDGLHCLCFWQKTLKEYAAAIGNLADAVAESLEGKRL